MPYNQSCVTVPQEPIPLSVPVFRGNEWKYVKECLDTGWVSAAGPFVERFEQEIAAYVGAKYAVAAVNGTAAIHMALHVIGLLPDEEVMPIYDAAMRYKEARVPLVVLAGKEYGSGSSRDWAAKGTRLLGVRVVIAESFERIHRSNLVNMGTLPLQFKPGESVAALKLTGLETFDVAGIAESLRPTGEVAVRARAADGRTAEFAAVARIETPEELIAFRHGGILPYVLRQLLSSQ